MHRGDRRKETTHTIRETEAEAVAFVVCCAIGLDTNTSSSDHIQLHAGDKATLAESLAFIQQTRFTHPPGDRASGELAMTEKAAASR